MPARAFPAMFWLGEGPIYTTMAWASVPPATFSLSRLPVEGDGRRAKTPWVADATYEGPVVIRGRSLRDDGKALRFKLSGSLVEQLRLQAPQTPVKGEPSFWATSMIIPGAGCYGIQIDTTQRTQVIVFEAT